MKRFDNRLGAAALMALAAAYMIGSLALGRSAHAEPPPDLSLEAAGAGLDVWKSVGASISPGAVFVDVRPRAEFDAYHIAGSVSVPDGEAARLSAVSRGRTTIIVAAKDAVAQNLVGAARAADSKGRYYFLQKGVRDWYLTFDLPVSLFSETAAPRGYDEALNTVKTFVASGDPRLRDTARAALFELVRMNYQPTLLKQAGKTKPAAGGAHKKISGGCGG